MLELYALIFKIGGYLLACIINLINIDNQLFNSAIICNLYAITFVLRVVFKLLINDPVSSIWHNYFIVCRVADIWNNILQHPQVY